MYQHSAGAEQFSYPSNVTINESVNITPEEYQQLINEDIVCMRNDSKNTRHFGSRQLYLGADHLTFEGRVQVISSG